MTRLGPVVIALLATVTLVGCTDWDNGAKKVAREMQRIGFGCQDFQKIDAKPLAPRGITAAGTCHVHEVQVTISVFKNKAALRADLATSAARCRAAPEPSRALQSNVYVIDGRSLVEGSFTNITAGPQVVSAFWAPTATDIAAATHGRVEHPLCW